MLDPVITTRLPSSNGMFEKLQLEIEGAKNYIELATEESDIVEAKCLMAIAKDEYQHAMFLVSMLKDEGVYDLPQTTKNDLHMLEATFRKYKI